MALLLHYLLLRDKAAPRTQVDSPGIQGRRGPRMGAHNARCLRCWRGGCLPRGRADGDELQDPAAPSPWPWERHQASLPAPATTQPLTHEHHALDRRCCDARRTCMRQAAHYETVWCRQVNPGPQERGLQKGTCRDGRTSRPGVAAKVVFAIYKLQNPFCA